MAIPTLHSGQLSGPQDYPHLVDADIVSKGALDHWRVVIDVQDGHLQDVVLLPWRGATVGRHNLQGGGRLESGLEGGGWMRNMESRRAVCSVGRTARSQRLAGPSLPPGPSTLPKVSPSAPCCKQLLPDSYLLGDLSLQSVSDAFSLYLPILPRL